MNFTHGRRTRRLAILATCLSLLPGCPWVIKPQPKPKTVDEQHDAVVEHFNQRTPHEDFVHLNLANQDHYEYAKHRLQEAVAGSQGEGQTPSKDFARALQTLEVAHAEAVSGDPQPKPTDWNCDHFIHVNDSRTVDGGRGAQANKGVQQQPPQEAPPALIISPYATCAGGSTHVFTDVTVYESDLAGKKLRVLAKSANEEHNDGKTFDDTTVKVTPSMEPNRKVVVESMMVAHNDKTGEEHVSFSSLETSLVAAPASFTLDHPRFASNEPRSNINLTTCQLRGGADCDYAMVSNASGTLAPFPAQSTGLALRKTGAPWTGDPAAYFPFQAGTTFDNTNIYIPTQGTFDAGATATADCVIQAMQKAPMTTRLRLIKTDTGGTCTTLADVSDAFPVGARTTTIQRLVNVSQNTTASGGTGCTMEKIVNEAVVLSMTLYAQAICGTGAAIPRTVTFTSTALPTNPFNLNVLNSCMAEGTRITMADGAQKPIETLRVGDKVRANAAGRVLTVQDFIFGREPKPLVRLRDDQGHDVRLTEKHPVLLSSGLVIAAEKVQVKDTVRTQTGTATITATERVPYDGKVYNLKLGTAEELESLSPNERTMFADGLLVGDDTMQRELDSPRRASAKP